MPNLKKKVVVMGGGTGIFPVISALKQLDVDICSIVAVSDSGGFSGRIRDEFGFPPVGDLRQSLAALAENEAENWIQKLLLYRFSKGDGLRGHNLGNLILTALQDMTGDTSKALEIAERVFRLEGTVIPVTGQNVNLKINYDNGSSAVGEHLLDADRATVESNEETLKIKNVELTPAAELNPLAKQAIEAADMIIIGPGDYYASLMAVLVPSGVKSAFANTKGKVLYILNLMTRLTQTQDMPASAHVQGIEETIGRPVDMVVVNNEPISDETLSLYAQEKEFPVIDDLGDDKQVVRAPIISNAMVIKATYDISHRSLLRHDSKKLLSVLKPLL